MAQRMRVLPYGSIGDKNIKKLVGEITKLRRKRTVGAAGAGTGLAVSIGALKATEIAGIVSGSTIAGFGYMAHSAEDAIVDATSLLGKKLASSRGMAKQIKAMAGEGYTHAHVDGKGNLVFTGEPGMLGKVLRPRMLRPTTWRWRMKVPIPAARKSSIDLKSAKYKKIYRK